MEIRRSYDRLISTMAFPILVRWHLYIESGSRRQTIIRTNDDLVHWTLEWRNNEHDGVPNHQHHDCLLNPFFRRRSKTTSKLRAMGLCVGNSPVTGEFPAQRTSYVLWLFCRKPWFTEVIPFSEIVMPPTFWLMILLLLNLGFSSQYPLAAVC